MSATLTPPVTPVAPDAAPVVEGGRPARTLLGRVVPWVAVAAAVLAVALAAGPGRRSGPPADPRSTDPSGAKAFVLLLGRLGHRVAIGSDPPARGAAVVLRDELGDHQRDRIRAWVDRGGLLVVADPFSALAPPLGRDRGPFTGGSPAGELRPACDLPALAGVGRIHVPVALGFRDRPGALGCFPVAGGSYLSARSSGEGTVVGLGGAAPFTNELLGDADNAVLAASVVGRGDVVVLQPDAPGSGSTSLVDLVSPRVKNGLWQLLAAFLVVVLWRARRLGRPIVEAQPVEVPGAELVVAVGNLLHQARRRDQAAAMLRADTRRLLAQRFGLPPDAPAAVLADALAGTASVLTGDAAAALEGPPPPDDAGLLALARSLATLRRKVTDV